MASSAADLTSRLLRHERGVLVGAVLMLATLSWIFVLDGMVMDSMHPPLWALVVMWSIMMVAMMLPSATPAILLYATVRKSRQPDNAAAQPWVFLAGYLLVWLVFSVVAALVQSRLPSAAMGLESRTAQAALLIAAGLYQLSPLKSACISQCRSPAQFISRHWQPGWDGAIWLGMRHGAYCVGCCWLLMALLFVGGIMNLLWIAGLTLLVAIEKLAPRGALFGRAVGLALIVWGLAKVAGY